MRVLVTGGSGFIGSWIIHELCRRGIEPRVLDVRDERSILRQIGAPADAIDWRIGDISRPKDVEAAAQGCDAAIHLAGLLLPACKKDPVRGAEINLIGTLNLFKAGLRHGFRCILYTSSAGVFGPHDGGTPLPTTHYGAFKLACEGSARAYWADHQLPSIGFRPYVVYGPGRELGASAGASLACRAAVRNEAYVIPYTGAAGMIYVQDVVRLFCEALLSEATGAQVCNLAGATASVDDVIHAIKRRYPAARISASGSPLPIACNLTDTGLPDFACNVPMTSLQAGIDATLAHYQAIEAGADVGAGTQH